MMEVAHQNENLEQLKKQEFYAKQAEAEQRKAELEAEKQKMLEQKRLEEIERDEYRLGVRTNMF